MLTRFSLRSWQLQFSSTEATSRPKHAKIWKCCRSLFIWVILIILKRGESCTSSRKHACIYFDPLKPHFYTVNWGLQGYILFLLFLLKNIDNFYLKTFSFWWWNYQYSWIGVFPNVCIIINIDKRRVVHLSDSWFFFSGWVKTFPGLCNKQVMRTAFVTVRTSSSILFLMNTSNLLVTEYG